MHQQHAALAPVLGRERVRRASPGPGLLAAELTGHFPELNGPGPPALGRRGRVWKAPARVRLQPKLQRQHWRMGQNKGQAAQAGGQPEQRGSGVNARHGHAKNHTRLSRPQQPGPVRCQ